MLRPVRVKPTKAPRGSFRADIGWGMLAGLMTQGLGLLLGQLQSMLFQAHLTWFMISGSFGLAVALIPTLLVLVRGVSRSARLLPGVLAGVSIGLGFSVSMVLVAGLDRGTIARSPVELVGVTLVLGSAAVFALVVLAVAAHPLRYLLPGRIAAQTGSLCWACGYDLAGLDPSAVCPECGKVERTPVVSKKLAAADRVLARVGLPIVLAIFVLAPLGSQLRWWVGPGQTRRALLAIGADEFIEDVTTSDPVHAIIGMWSADWLADGAVFHPEGVEPIWTMLIVPRPGSDLGPQLVVSRSPAIRASRDLYTDLTDEQFAWVLEHGLPASLIRDMAVSPGRGVFHLQKGHEYFMLP